MIEPYSETLLWVLIVGFIVAFILAFGIGANDVANSFGTSVGSKVLTVRSACYLATFFEIAGAVLIGYKVSDTMRKGILDVSLYADHEKELMLGCLSSLAGSALWLMLATFLKLPISGTHSIVGATVGFSLVCRGPEGLHWKTLGAIVASWFISPVLSGVVSVVLFLVIRRYILSHREPLIPGLASLPFFYGFTMLINVFSIVHNGPQLLFLDQVPWWGALIASLVSGLLVAVGVHFIFVPYLRRRCIDDLRLGKESKVNFSFGDSTESSREATPNLSRDSRSFPDALTFKAPAATDPLPVITEAASLERALNPTPPTGSIDLQNNTGNGFIHVETNLNTTGNNGLAVSVIEPTSRRAISTEALSPNASAVPLIRETAIEAMELGAEAEGDVAIDDDPPEMVRIFSFLQILTAIFGSFAHGGNDVSNAIGPLVALWLIYKDGNVAQESETPIAILLYGGVGITVGLWLWGRRVIKTIGEDLTKITASTGFTIEIGSALTVLLASKIGLPISTTHCKVGSVVFVGWASSARKGVDWKLFRNIIFAWIVTVPLAGLISAATMGSFKALALYE